MQTVLTIGQRNARGVFKEIVDAGEIYHLSGMMVDEDEDEPLARDASAFESALGSAGGKLSARCLSCQLQSQLSALASYHRAVMQTPAASLCTRARHALPKTLASSAEQVQSAT